MPIIRVQATGSPSLPSHPFEPSKQRCRMCCLSSDRTEWCFGVLCCRNLSGRSNSRKQEALCYFSIESGGALIVSLFINVFIISVFAKGFFGKGIEDIGLANAGHYLGDAFGRPVVSSNEFTLSTSACMCFRLFTRVACSTLRKGHRLLMSQLSPHFEAWILCLTLSGPFSVISTIRVVDQLRSSSFPTA